MQGTLPPTLGTAAGSDRPLQRSHTLLVTVNSCDQPLTSWSTDQSPPAFLVSETFPLKVSKSTAAQEAAAPTATVTNNNRLSRGYASDTSSQGVFC